MAWTLVWAFSGEYAGEVSVRHAGELYEREGGKDVRTTGRPEGKERGSSTWSAESFWGRESRAVMKALAKLTSVMAAVVHGMQGKVGASAGLSLSKDGP